MLLYLNNSGFNYHFFGPICLSGIIFGNQDRVLSIILLLLAEVFLFSTLSFCKKLQVTKAEN